VDASRWETEVQNSCRDMHSLLGNVDKPEWCGFWQSTSSQSYVGNLSRNALDLALVISTEGRGAPTNKRGVRCTWNDHPGDFRKQWMKF
jgi:hypothetical protein